jgi:hypothetical protein
MGEALAPGVRRLPAGSDLGGGPAPAPQTTDVTAPAAAPGPAPAPTPVTTPAATGIATVVEVPSGRHGPVQLGTPPPGLAPHRVRDQVFIEVVSSAAARNVPTR